MLWESMSTCACQLGRVNLSIVSAGSGTRGGEGSVLARLYSGKSRSMSSFNEEGEDLDANVEGDPVQHAFLLNTIFSESSSASQLGYVSLSMFT